jgi:hypothetical protein
MHSAIVIEEFKRRLVELGCPIGRVRRNVQELADHHEDLKSDALEEGLSEAAAEAQATQRLGEPVALAEHVAAVLRNSSWWGRHPVLSFCVLPPLGIVFIAMLALLLETALARLYFSPEELNLLANDERGLEFFRAILKGTYYGAVALTTTLFCRLAWRSARGLNWALIACTFCLLHSYFFSLRIAPHMFSIGYTFPSRIQDFVATGIPLLVAVAAYVWQWRTARILALSPGNGRGGSAG